MSFSTSCFSFLNPSPWMPTSTALRCGQGPRLVHSCFSHAASALRLAQLIPDPEPLLPTAPAPVALLPLSSSLLLLPSARASSGYRYHTHENGSQTYVSNSDPMACGEHPSLVIIRSLRLDTPHLKLDSSSFSLQMGLLSWCSYTRNTTILQLPDPSEPSCCFTFHSQSCINSCQLFL